MSYSPFGADDSDLEDWIRQQAESGALDDLASPSPMQPMAAFQPPPHAEMAPLKLDTGPDWSDALGAGTTALAALADLGLNHGRGTGQILAAGGQFGQARAEQRLKGTQDALSYEQKRAEIERQNNYNDYLYASLGHRVGTAEKTDEHKTTGEALRGREVAVKEAGSGRADAKVERDTNAESDYAQQFRDFAYERGLAKPGELDNMSYEQMKSANPALLKAWEYDHAGSKAATETGARIDATNARAGATGAAKATELDAQSDVRVKQAAAEAAAREGATGSGARAQQGADRADEAARQARYNKFRDETEKTRPQVGIAANLDKVLAKYPQGDAPGVGVWDSFKSGKLASNDDLAVRGAVTNMTDLVARVRSGAAIPPKEFENISRFVDGGEGASEQQFRVAYNAYKRTLQDEMKQQARGRESEARDVLGEYGDYALGPQAPAPVRAGGGALKQAQKPGAYGNVNQPLGGGSNGSAGSQAVQKPDGSFDIDGYTYSAEEVQRLRAMGAIQ